MQIPSQTHRVLPEDEAVVVVVGTGAVVGVRDGPFCRLAWEWSDDPCSFLYRSFFWTDTSGSDIT